MTDYKLVKLKCNEVTHSFMFLYVGNFTGLEKKIVKLLNEPLKNLSHLLFMLFNLNTFERKLLLQVQ